MANAHFFGEDTLELGLEAGGAPNLARRQFTFSLIIGVLLLAAAGIVGARPLVTNNAPVAVHQINVVAPEPAQSIALPNALSRPEG